MSNMFFSVLQCTPCSNKTEGFLIMVPCARGILCTIIHNILVEVIIIDTPFIQVLFFLKNETRIRTQS